VERHLMNLRVAARRALVALSAVAVAGVAVWAAAWTVPLPDRLETPGSAMVLYRDGLPAHVELSPDEKWRIPVAVEEVDPDYVEALVRLEDKRFYMHAGVDPIAVGRAVVQNARSREVVSGASTLTMQLARLVEPRPRTLQSKVVEAARAVQFEVRLSKDEILAAYLTFVPYGRNVEGIEAASWAYFGHSAAELDPVEIATLLAVPQNPNARYPAPDNAVRLRAARDEIADRLLAVGALPTGSDEAPLSEEEVLAQVKAAPVPDRLRPVPRGILHAAGWLREGRGTPPRLETTLDRGVQALAERVLANHQEEARLEGIHNASVVVVDHRTAEIRALVGSFDFWDAEHGGQIVGFDNPRSPGSTLKPFIYARAIDRGIILPEHLRPDIPVRYGTYAPENYDGRFAGVVRMEEALSRSLNVPFVNLLQDVEVEPFLADLRAMGARHLESTPGHYGLSAAAGGIELTPLEMAALFTTLAEDGRYRPLTAVPLPRDERQVLSKGAVWLTRRALMLKDRPDFPSRRELSSAPRRIHWKTGTSFGHRDAWAIGSGERYTVVVWMGNFDNTGSIHLVGSEAAGPVLFDLLEGLDDGARGPARLPPADLIEVEVCALSGHLPTEACPRRSTALALVHQVPTEQCPYHHAVEVDVATGQAVTPLCREGRETRVDSYVLWPSAVRRWLDDRSRWQPSRPPLAPGCEPVAHTEPPRILSPSREETVVLLPGVAASDQEVPLEAESALADASLSWFVDGEWVGSASADERLWWTPEPGVHEVVVLDARGLSSRVEVEVSSGALARVHR
jgi:penicillin-binding protein 1C